MILEDLVGRLRRHSVLVRMFSSAVTNQALLSASNLLVGLALIRGAPDEEYGYYLLVVNTILLLTSLQGSFLHPTMSMRVATVAPAERADLIGGLLRAQNRLLARVAASAVALLLVAWLAHLVNDRLAVLLVAGIVASSVALYREYFRTVFFVIRLPHDLLKADVLYALAQLVGVALATRTASPAVATLLFSSLAALVGALRLSHTLNRRGEINRNAAPGVWREISNHGGWSAAGSAAHWMFSQGYNYVVAGVLDVASVSALGATRLLLMPINLMSSGVGPLMMPFAAEWLQEFGPKVVLRRVVLISLALVVLAGGYLLLMWFARDWIFDHVMHKHFAHASALLAAWSATFLLTIFRDQLRTFPATFGKFKHLFMATIIGALVSLTLCYLGVKAFGVVGAPIAVLFGELLNTLFIVFLSFQLVRG